MVKLEATYVLGTYGLIIRVGSSPTIPRINASIAQWIEHSPSKRGITVRFCIGVGFKRFMLGVV